MPSRGWLLRCCVALTWLVVWCQGQALTILSQYRQAYVLNGAFQQINTMTIQCTDSDFGIWRYLAVTRADGTSQTVGVRCNAPTYTYTKTLVGYVPADGVALAFSNCLVQNPYSFDSSLLAEADFTRAPTNPGQLVAQSIHRHQKHVSVNPDHRLHKRRKGLLVSLLGGAIGGVIYCAIAGCGGGGGADQGKLDELNNRINALKQAGDELKTATDTMTGQITQLFTAQAQFADNVTASLQTTQQLFTEQLNLANQSLQAQRSTTDYLTYLNGGLTQDLGNLRTQMIGTQSQLGTLEQSVISGFNVTAGNLAAIVRDMTYIEGNLSLQINTSSTLAANRLGYLRSRLEKLTIKTQSQINLINDLIRNTQARRALTRFVTSQIQGIVDQGYTPFLATLGTQPAPDTSEFVWKMNIEVSRVLYIRNSGGLTAQQLDVAWYCNTQQIIEFGDSVSSYLDIFRHFGPNFCNSTVANNCTCWAVSQRYSCAITANAYNNSDWFLQSDLRASNVCTSAVTTDAAVSHVTLDSLLVVLSTVCNDGTWNNGDLRVISGMLGRSASIPYNALVCDMVFDTMADVTATGLNFMYGILFYMQLSFIKVFQAKDSYAKYIYGTLPDGITTIEDPLAVVNGTDVRCFYSAFMSYEGIEPMPPLYKLTFASTTASVTVTVDNVTSTDVTEVTQAVPNDIVLPPSDEYVVGEPADTSVLYNVPYSALTASPSPQGRCGGVDYPIIDNPANFTIVKWNAANRAIFDHFCGTNVASYYRRTLNGQGLCTGTGIIGEGTQCTVRQNFEVSSVVGGVQYQPRTGTSATTIVRVNIPDGNITSLLFSECPSISLAQTAPNVATLTLGNPRPDGDIVVAIVLGGQCSATVSSFTIARNTQRDYLIPVCTGRTSSARTVTVFRYDAQAQLQLCGNTTNFTVDRQTYLNTFATPDVIQVNLTSQVSLDSTQLTLLRTMNDMRNIVAEMVVAVVQSHLDAGTQLSPTIYNLYDSVITKLQYNAQLGADLYNTTRNTALFDYDGNLASYRNVQQQFVASANASLNASKALLGVLSNQVANVTAVNVLLQNFTITANSAVSIWGAAFNNYLNVSQATWEATRGYLNSIRFGSSFGLGGLGDFFGGIGSFLVDDVLDPGIQLFKEGIGYVAKAVVGAVNFAKDLLDKALGAVLGFGNSIFQIVFYIIIVICGLAGIAALAYVYKFFSNHQLSKLMSGTLASTDLADHPTQIQAREERAARKAAKKTAKSAPKPGTAATAANQPKITSTPLVPAGNTGGMSMAPVATKGNSSSDPFTRQRNRIRHALQNTQQPEYRKITNTDEDGQEYEVED